MDELDDYIQKAKADISPSLSKVKAAQERARKLGHDISDDVVADFYDATMLESGRSHYRKDGRVKESPRDPKDGQVAVGFSQIKPGTIKRWGNLDPYNENDNITGGLLEFNSIDSADPIARRIGYFAGGTSDSLKKYRATGKIPRGGDFTGTSFQEYIAKSNGFKAVDDYIRSAKGGQRQSPAVSSQASAPETGDLDTYIRSSVQQIRQPSVTPQPTTPPVIEAAPTIDAQFQAAGDPAVKTRSAVFFPANDAARATEYANKLNPQEWGLFNDSKHNNGSFLVNLGKAQRLKLRSPQDIQQFIDGNPNAIRTLTGIVDNVGGNTTGLAVTAQKNGIEQATSIVTTPESADAQAQVYRDQFPDADIGVTDSEAVARQRLEGTREDIALGEPAPDTSGMTLAQADAAGQRSTNPVMPQSKQPVANQPAAKQQVARPANVPFDEKAFASANEYLTSQGQPPLSKEQFIAATQGPGDVTVTEARTTDINGKPINEFEQETEIYGGRVKFPRVAGKQTDANGDIGVFTTNPKMTEAEAFRAANLAVGSRYGVDPQKIEEEIRRKGGKGLFADGYRPGGEIIVDKDSLIALGADPTQFRMEQVQNRINSNTPFDSPQPSFTEVVGEEIDKAVGERDERGNLTPEFQAMQDYRNPADTEDASLVAGALENVADTTFGQNRAGMRFATGAGTGLVSSLSNALAGAIDLSMTVPKLAGLRPAAGGAYLGNVLGRLGTRAEQVHSLSTPSNPVYKFAGQAGDAFGKMPLYIGAAALARGNPILTFAIADGIQAKGKGSTTSSVLGATAKGAATGLAFAGVSRFANAVTEGLFDGTIANAIRGFNKVERNPIFERLADTAENRLKETAARQITAAQALSEDAGATAGERFAAQKAVERLLKKHNTTLADVQAGRLTGDAARDIAIEASRSNGSHWARELTRTGIKVGSVSGLGYGLAKAEGASDTEAANQALLFAAMEVFGALMHKPKGSKFTPEEVKQADGTVLRLMDENGKPNDVVVTATKDGTALEVTDVTGKVPEEAVSAVAPLKSGQPWTELKLTDEEVATAEREAKQAVAAQDAAKKTTAIVSPEINSETQTDLSSVDETQTLDVDRPDDDATVPERTNVGKPAQESGARIDPETVKKRVGEIFRKKGGEAELDTVSPETKLSDSGNSEELTPELVTDAVESVAQKEPYEMTQAEYREAFPTPKDGETVTAADGGEYVVQKGVDGKSWAKNPVTKKVKIFANPAELRKFVYGHSLHKSEVGKAVKAGNTVDSRILAEYPQYERIANRQVADRVLKFQADEKASEVFGQIAAKGKAGLSINKLHQIAKQYHVSPSEVIKLVKLADASYRRKQGRVTNNAGTRPAAKQLVGKEHKINVPGEKKDYTAKYVVRELADVYPSHNPFNFNPNPDYWHTNDRHYDKQIDYKSSVVDDSLPNNFRADHVVNTNPTAETGAPIIDRDGNVLGGNSRTMKIARIYASENAKAKNAYIAKVKEDAGAFGIDPAAVANFNQPVLVREVTGDVDAQNAITDFNKTSAKRASATESAIAGGKNVSVEALAKIVPLAKDIDRNGAEIVSQLIKDGAVSANDKNALVQDDKLTEQGKDAIQNLLLGNVFTDLEQMEYVPNAVKNTVKRAIVPILQTESNPDWNIVPKVREAIDLVTERSIKAKKMTLDEYSKQKSIDGKEWSPESVAIGKALEDGNVEPFKVYAGEMNAAETGSMFGAITPDEAFEIAFNGKNDLAMAAVSSEPFYSRVESVVRDKMPPKATPAQVTALLAKNSVKELDPEMQAIKVWLDGQDGTVSKDAVLEFVDANKVVVSEVVKSSTSNDEIEAFTDDRVTELIERDGIAEWEEVVGTYWTTPHRVTYGENEGEYEVRLADGDTQFFSNLRDAQVALAKDRGEFADQFEKNLSDAEQAEYRERATRETREDDLFSVRDGDTKFAQFQLPGESENYREEFLTAPVEKTQPLDTSSWTVKHDIYAGSRRAQVFDGEGNRIVAVIGASDAEAMQHALERATGTWQKQQNWKDGHSQFDDVVNPIARIRYNDRTTTDGDKMLFAEEIQQPSKENLAKMPKVYQKFGEEMAIRKMLYRAVEGGYDYFGFTTGAQQADRYNLAKTVDYINWNDFGMPDRKSVSIKAKDETLIRLVVNPDGIIQKAQPSHNVPQEWEGKHLAEAVGKEIAPRILESKEGKLEGDGLKVGGTGLASRYDRKHVDYINRLMKPYGVQVEAKEIATGINTDDQEIRTSIDSDGLYTVETGSDSWNDLTEAEADAKVKELKGSTEIIHAVRISPEFKKAVEASMEENGGAFPLFKLPDNSAEAKRLHELAALDSLDESHIESVKTSAPSGGEYLKTNPEGLELNRVIDAIAQGKERKDVTVRHGRPYSKKEATEHIEAANAVRDALKDDGFDTSTIDKYIKDFQKVADANNGRVPVATETGKAHEIIHVKDDISAEVEGVVLDFEERNGEASKILKTDPAFQKFHTELNIRSGKTILHGAAMAEAIAYLGNGYHDEFGLTVDESAHILATIVQGRFDKLGADSLTHFNVKGAEKLYEAIERITEANTKAESGRDGTSDDSRSEGDQKRQDEPRNAESPDEASGEKGESSSERDVADLDDDAVIAELTGSTVKDVKTKNRKFAQTMANNLFDISDVEYDPNTFPDALGKGFDTVESKGIDGAIEKWRNMAANNAETRGDKTALGTAIAIEMYNEGRQDDLIPFGKELTAHVGNAAQELVMAKLMSRLSPAFASIHADKYTLEAFGRVQTEKERAKTDAIAEKLQTASDTHAFSEAAIQEATDRADAFVKQLDELNKVLEDEKNRTRSAEMARDIALEALEQYKASRQNSEPKSRSALQKLKTEIVADRSSLIAAIRNQFPNADLAMAVKGSKPADSKLEDDAIDALVKMGAVKLIDDLPKGITPSEFDDYIQGLTGNALLPSELNYIHANAYEMTRPERSAMTAEARALLNNRLNHSRRAKVSLGVPSEEINKARESAIKRQIAALEKEIETGEKPAPPERVPDSDIVTKLKQQRDELKAKRQSHLDRNTIANNIRAKALERQIAALEKRIETGQKPVFKPIAPTTAKVDDLKQKVADLKKQLEPSKPDGEVYRRDKFAAAMLDTARNLDMSNDAVMMAFAIRETPNLHTLRQLFKDVHPDSTDKQFNEAFRDGQNLYNATKANIAEARDRAKFGADKTPEEISALKILAKDSRTEERLAQKELEHHFKELTKPLYKKVGAGALDIWNATRSFLFSLDNGFLVAQGGLPMVMNTKAWLKSVKGITPAWEMPALKRWISDKDNPKGISTRLRELIPGFDKQLAKYGFTGESFENAVTRYYDSAIRKALESHGAKFEVIGNVADFNENFMSELTKKVPLVRQTNLAHAMATDLMRLNVGEQLFGEIDKMYKAGKLNALEANRAKEFIAGKWGNVITGKGFTPGWTHGLFRGLANIGSAPSLALSSLQFLYYTNPVRMAMLPKGARKIVLKGATRAYGALLLALLPAMMLGLVNGDPEDKDFGVFDMGKLLPRLADVKFNIFRQLKEPMRLTMGLGVKKLIYELLGNKEGSQRINNEWYHELVMDEFGGLGAFWKGKAHPSISYLNTLWTGKNFVGEPASTLDYIPVVPLILKEGVQAATYSHKESVLKSGKGGNVEDNLARLAFTLLTSYIGFGASSYPATGTTTATKQAQALMPPDTRSPEDKAKSQKANQFERLIREGIDINDISEDMSAAIRAGLLTQKDVDKLMATYKDEIGEFESSYGTTLTDKQKQVLMANRRAFKILDYLWKDKKLSWEALDAAARFATREENTLNDRAALAEAESIVLEAVARGSRITGQGVDTDTVVEMYQKRQSKMSEADKEHLRQVLMVKAGNSAKAKSLTPSEIENIKTVIPDFTIDAALAAAHKANDEKQNRKNAKAIRESSLPNNVRAEFESLNIQMPGFGDTLTPVKGGGARQLTPELHAKYQQDTYDRVAAKVQSLMSKSAYQRANSELRTKMIEGIIRKQRAEEAKEIKREMIRQMAR